VNELLLFIAGVFVNAPYALITTAVSAELGSIVPSKSALATVSGIIDATGSLGSAIGPSLAGVVSEYGWNYVFVMVMVSDLLALICILRIGFKDFKHLRKKFFPKQNLNEVSTVTVL
jgi:OPA family glycerol-3-phosphate transporter-like MFS transporter 1/2